MKKLLLSSIVTIAFALFGATNAAASQFNDGMLIAHNHAEGGDKKMSKCGEGKCGGDSKSEDKKMSKCGEGKCGGDSKSGDKKMSKCGAGKCGS